MDNNKFWNAKAVFFDIGDTLYSNEDLEKEYPRQLYKLIAETKNIDVDQAKNLLKATTEKLKATEKHVTKVRAMKELGYTRAEVHEAYCKVDPHHFLSKDHGVIEVIEALAAKYRLGLISNFKKSHIAQILDALGLTEQQFPLMVTEDIVQEIKPDPEPFLKAVDLAGALAYECIYVGDSPSKDMRPAKEVGMTTILVKANPEPKDLEHADLSIENIQSLATLL